MLFQHSLRTKLALSALLASVLLFAPTRSLAAAAPCEPQPNCGTVTVSRIDLAGNSANNAACDTANPYAGYADCYAGSTCDPYTGCTSPADCGALRCSGDCSTICTRRGNCLCDPMVCTARACQDIRSAACDAPASCFAAPCYGTVCGESTCTSDVLANCAAQSPRRAPAAACGTVCPIPATCPTAAPTATACPTASLLPEVTPAAPQPTATPSILPTIEPVDTATAAPAVEPIVTPAPTATVIPILPTIAPTAAPTPTDPNYTRNDYAAQEAELLSYVNEDRVSNGLSPLTLNDTLVDVARFKSQDMADNNYFDHTSPTVGGMKDLLAKFGVRYSAAGENIAHYGSIEKAHAALMSSEGHRRNILGASYTQIGIGITQDGRGGYLITEEFLRP